MTSTSATYANRRAVCLRGIVAWVDGALGSEQPKPIGRLSEGMHPFTRL
jgi:hypothetical protein